MSMDTEKDETRSLKTGIPKKRYRPNDLDFVAPDGGWGWLILIACGTSNLCVVPMMQEFGLIFLTKFKRLNISSVQTATIINVTLATWSCVCLLNGPIYRRFSYRKVALFGNCLVIFSLSAIIFCDTFWSYLIFIGVFYGSAVGITITANIIALNTYFKKKRGIAAGLSWGITAIGSILWPYVTTYLLDTYGTEGTILMFVAIACHSLIFSLLLQPVHWHTSFRTIPNISCNKNDHNRQVNKSGLLTKIVESFHLDLFKDPIFISIMLGTSLSRFCEMNFMVITPFVLNEFDFVNYEIATVMTLLAASDVLFRFSFPFVANKLGVNVRTCCIVGMLFAAIGRVVLIHTQTFEFALLTALLIGFGRALCIVYFSILIPNHVSLEQLPSATGIQCTANGLMYICLGSFIGLIRDIFNNYVITLHVLNVFNYVTILMWVVELKLKKSTQETTSNQD